MNAVQKPAAMQKPAAAQKPVAAPESAVPKAKRNTWQREAVRGALDLIAAAGGGVVESYPHDLTDQTKKMSSSFLYNGTRRLYERLGFSYVRPKGLKNCVMSIEIDPS